MSEQLNGVNVSLLNAFGQAGEMSNILLGICEIYVGYHIAMLISVVCIAAGYFMLAFTDSFVVAAVSYFLIGLGSGGVLNNLVARNAHSFAIRYRGTVVGVLMGAVGVSGLIWMAVSTLLELKSFFLLLAGVAILSGILALLFVEKLETVSVRNSDHERSTSKYVEDNYRHVEITGLSLFTFSHFWILAILMFVGYGVSVSWMAEMGIALQDPDYKDYLNMLVYLFVAFTTLGLTFVVIVNKI